MRKIIVYTIVALTVCSCQYKVDNTDPFKVGEAFFEGITKKDTTILNQLFITDIDSLEAIYKNNLSDCMSSLNDNEPVELLKIDTSTSINPNQTVIDIILKQGGQFYRARTFHRPNESNTIQINALFFHKISKECEDYNNTPYCPSSSIDFKKINWTSDNSQTFLSGTILVENKTSDDIKYIKFRVVLKKGNDWWAAEPFFNQTVESYNTIFKGDIATIDIPGLRNYYTGFDIKNDDTYLDAELIEVGPKPISYWCKILNELKDEKSKE